MLPFKLVYHPDFVVDLGPHVFPAQKYRLVREQLLREGVAEPGDFLEPSSAQDEDIARVHTSSYLEQARTGRFSSSERLKLEVPWSETLARAAWRASGAAIVAGDLALEDGCAVVICGGFHHAFPDHGEGFCLINDVAVAAAALRARGRVVRVAVVDLDVHHGNGTATILGNDPASLTVSLHQENNYPAIKPPSHVDVGLPDGTTDAEYFAALEGPLARVAAFDPDIVFYLAGADPYEQDLLGGLALSLDGLRERDHRVLAMAREASLPVVVTLAGGYARHTGDTITIHVNTVRTAAEVFQAASA